MPEIPTKTPLKSVKTIDPSSASDSDVKQLSLAVKMLEAEVRRLQETTPRQETVSVQNPNLTEVERGNARRRSVVIPDKLPTFITHRSKVPKIPLAIEVSDWFTAGHDGKATCNRSSVTFERGEYGLEYTPLDANEYIGLVLHPQFTDNIDELTPKRVKPTDKGFYNRKTITFKDKLDKAGIDKQVSLGFRVLAQNPDQKRIKATVNTIEEAVGIWFNFDRQRGKVTESDRASFVARKMRTAELWGDEAQKFIMEEARESGVDLTFS